MTKGLTSIVLVTWVETEERLGFLKRTMTSILENTTMPYELIVVDNGGVMQEDYINQLLETGKIYVLIRNAHNFGIGRARNQGIGSAKGEFLFSIDNDIVLKKGWLEKCHELIDKEEKLIVSPLRSLHTREVQRFRLKKEEDYDLWARAQPIWLIRTETARKFRWPEYPHVYARRPGTYQCKQLSFEGYRFAMPTEPYADHIGVGRRSFSYEPR